MMSLPPAPSMESLAVAKKKLSPLVAVGWGWVGGGGGVWFWGGGAAGAGLVFGAGVGAARGITGSLMASRAESITYVSPPAPPSSVSSPAPPSSVSASAVPVM